MKENNTTIGVVMMMLIITTAITMIIVAIPQTQQQQQEAYAQGLVTYDSPIGEQQQAFVAQTLNNLLNKTSEPSILIWEDADMYFTWTETVTTTAPDGRVFEIEETTQLRLPHNFTTENGYSWRDNTIYKPDGTELFS